MLTSLAIAQSAAQQENWPFVIHCLQQLLPQLEKDESSWQPVRELAFQVLEKGDFQQKWDVEKIFPQLGESVIIPLAELLEQEDSSLESRWFAGRILSQFDHPLSIMALVKILQQTEEEDLIETAFQALSHIGDSAIEALSQFLCVPAYRTLAVQGLTQIHHQGIIEPLMSVVDDPVPEIRAMAIEALANFQDIRLLDIFLKGLTDYASRVRKESIIALSRNLYTYPNLTLSDLVKRLKPLLHDLNLEVCQQTTLALVRIGTDEAADLLFHALKSPATSPGLKLDLVRALGWMETHTALMFLQEALRWSDLEVCREIVSVLGGKNSPLLSRTATQILINFCHSEQQAASLGTIKQILAMSLGSLGQPDALETLQSLAQDSDRLVRLHALSALKKF